MDAKESYAEGSARTSKEVVSGSASIKEATGFTEKEVHGLRMLIAFLPIFQQRRMHLNANSHVYATFA